MQKNKDVIEINVVELFLFMLRRWYVFLLATIGTLIVGLIICLCIITPQYESTTKIIILSKQNENSLTYSDMQLASQLTKDYEELIVSRDVLESVIRKCSLKDDYDEFLDRIEVVNMADTRIISITVRDPSPEMAQRIADSVRETAAAHIKNVTDVEAVNTAEAANLPTEKSSPSVRVWAMLSVAFGFLAVFFTLLVRFLSDDTIKSSENVMKYLGLSALAIIPRVEELESQAGSTAKRKRNGRREPANARKTVKRSPISIQRR